MGHTRLRADLLAHPDPAAARAKRSGGGLSGPGEHRGAACTGAGPMRRNDDKGAGQGGNGSGAASVRAASARSAVGIGALQPGECGRRAGEVFGR